MENIIPAEATSYGSNGKQIYWYVIDRSLYIKGSGVVKNFYEVGYNSSIHAIVIEDDVWLHQEVFTGDENLRYLVVPDYWPKHQECPDHSLLVDTPDDWWYYCRDYPNLMVLEKRAEIVLVYASPKLVDVVIPEGVTLLGYSCFGSLEFERDSMLESVIIPDSVEEINNSAFNNCKKLKNVIIPTGVSRIGDTAFADCTQLTSISIPETVTEIEEYTFNGCTHLESVTIPDSITVIGERAFENCAQLTSIIIPDTVTEIKEYTFKGCTHLESVTIPDSITVIGEGAFAGCSALKTIHFPFNLLRIGDNAFANTSFDNIRIPDSVTEIGWGAFHGINNIEYYGSEPEVMFEYECLYWEWGSKAINGITANEWARNLDYSKLLRLEQSVMWSYKHNRKNEFQEGIVSAPSQFLHTILHETYQAEGQKISVKDFSESRQSYPDGRHLVYILLPGMSRNTARGFAAIYRQTEQGLSTFGTYRIYIEEPKIEKRGISDIELKTNTIILSEDANGLVCRTKYYYERAYIRDVFTGNVRYREDVLKCDRVVSYTKKVTSLEYIEEKLLDIHSTQFPQNT